MERNKPHKAMRHPTKGDVIYDIKQFPTVYRRQDISKLSNQMSRYKSICMFGDILEINSIFGMFIESWILRVSCKVTLILLETRVSMIRWRASRKLCKILMGFTLTLKETRSIHDSMNRPKIEILLHMFIFYYKYLKYWNYLLFRKQNSFVFDM